MPSVKICTLGCKLNSLESEAYIDAFKKAGYELYRNRGQRAGDEGQDEGSGEQPSIIIVNTCTVTSKADQKARRVIRKALRDFPEAVVIVTGCLAVLEKKSLTDLTEARRLLVLNREEILNYLKPVSCPSLLVPENHSASFGSLGDRFQFFPQKFSSHTRSFLKIQDGCDNHCTYCRIRLARGKSSSLPAEQVLERLRILEQTHAEAVLTGVNLSQYSSVSPCLREMNLPVLLEYLLANTDKIALRLSSLDPQFIVDSFLISHSSLLINKRIRPHFHLSIQSCSETVLRRMGRSYNSQIIEKAATILREAKDDPFLACDIITGFPGESEAEFMETYNLCKKIGFAWIHVFPYSKRPGTAAAAFKGAVHDSEITRRTRLLTELSRQGRQNYARGWIGREVEVIIEGAGGSEQGKGSRKKKESCRGISENYLKVLVRCKTDSPPSGTVLRCVLCKESDNYIDYDVIANV